MKRMASELGHKQYLTLFSYSIKKIKLKCEQNHNGEANGFVYTCLFSNVGDTSPLKAVGLLVLFIAQD